MPVIVMPKPLVDKLGDEGSRALVEVINESVRAAKLDWAELSGERFERRLAESTGVLRQEIANFRAELKEDIANLRTELKGDISNVWAELKEDIANLRAELKGDITNLRAEIKEGVSRSHFGVLRWMFVFWVGQVAAVAGILALFLK